MVLPSAASPTRPAPLVVFIHGGPLSSWSAWSWRWNPWLLAARGYAVLLGDPALSTGYGQAFVERGRGRWGAEPFTDLMALVDGCVARPEVDERRIAAMGGSFGGYMANWVAGQTDRFRCIVTHASIWSLEQFHGTTDHAAWWEREFGSPEAMPERYRDSSPDRNLARIRTPMLVIHGERDHRVPIGEALRLWTDLTRTGVEARFLYFPDENHWILTPPHVRVWYETVLAFLDHFGIADDDERVNPWGGAIAVGHPLASSGVRLMTQGSISEYFFLPLGLIAGYVTGLMLLRRTSRVFRWRLLVPLGGILVACGLCVLGIATDVFHVIRHVPKPDTIEAVTLIPIQSTYSNASLTLTEEASIEDVLAYHQGALRDWQQQVVDCLLQRRGHWSPGDYLNIQLRYTLKNGTTVQRRYHLEKENPAYDRLAAYLSTPELSLGMDEASLRAALAEANDGNSYLYSTDGSNPDVGLNRTFQNFQGLANAILADCREQNLMSLSLYSPPDGTESSDDGSNLRGWLSITYNQAGQEQYLYIDLNEKCTHTLYWISTHGEPSNAVG